MDICLHLTVGTVVKNLPANAGHAGDAGSIPGSARAPEEEMETHSRILAWEIPWIEEPNGLQSIGLQRVGHNWATEHEYMFLSKHLGVEWLSLIIGVHISFKENVKLFFKLVVHPWELCMEFQLSHFFFFFFAKGDIFNPSNFSQFNRYSVISHYSLNLHFPDDYQYWIPLHLLVCQLYIFLSEAFCYVLCPFAIELCILIIVFVCMCLCVLI